MSLGRTLINHLTYNVSIKNVHNSHPFRLLHDHICVGAFDNTDEYEEMKCYPGTRTVLLERLESWLACPGNPGRLITWLDGPMGSGKTAVARTMAERVSANDKLIGIFIFRRGEPPRDNESRFVATLAYQLALSVPLVRQFIEETLIHDPSVLQQSLSRQLDALILEPLHKMRSLHPDIDIMTLPNLIIVDGLDECGQQDKEETQIKILDLLHRLATAQDVLPFVILIHSRPERHIKNWFSAESHQRITERLSLDSFYKPNDDIRLFLTQSFLRTLEVHPSRHLLPPRWPYEIEVFWRSRPVNAIEHIIKRSSGQFIYPSIAMKFIASQRHRPDKHLLSILELGGINDRNSPDSVIDALYIQILESTDDHEVVRKVLMFNAVHSNPSVRIPLDRCLSLMRISRADFEHCIDQLGSLMTLRMRPFLRFHHASLSEFLGDSDRAKHWYVDRSHHASQVALRALQLFQDETYIGAQWSFFRVCSRSLRLAKPCVQLVQEIAQFCNFTSTSSSYHTPMMRFLKKMPLSIIATESLYSVYFFLHLTHDPPESRHIIWDCYLLQFASFVKPRIEPCLLHPAQLRDFLCWALRVPTPHGHSVERSWPHDFRCLINKLAVHVHASCDTLMAIFSLPSQEFLDEALVMVLRSAAEELPSLAFRHRGWNTLINLLRNCRLSERLWLCIMDYEELFPYQIRQRLHNELIAPAYQNITIEYLRIAPKHHPSMPILDIVPAEYEATRRAYWFIREAPLEQIVIPAVPALC